jgi:hypothetical protein
MRVFGKNEPQGFPDLFGRAVCVPLIERRIFLTGRRVIRACPNTVAEMTNLLAVKRPFDWV